MEVKGLTMHVAYFLALSFQFPDDYSIDLSHFKIISDAKFTEWGKEKSVGINYIFNQ